MAKAFEAAHAPSNYDPRWFIWTIVFLIVSGFALVSYLTIVGYNDSSIVVDFSTPHAVVKK